MLDQNSQKPLKKETVLKSRIKPMNSFMKWRHSIIRIPYTNQKAERDTILHAPDVAVLVIDSQHRIVLEKQWRGSVHSFTFEIPAGKIDVRDHQHPRHAALRELNEEVRIAPSRLQPLFSGVSCYNSPGCTNEATYFYLATGLKKVQRDLPRDKGEFMHLGWVPFSKALSLVKTGQIRDTQSIVAILAAARLKTLKLTKG